LMTWPSFSAMYSISWSHSHNTFLSRDVPCWKIGSLLKILRPYQKLWPHHHQQSHPSGPADSRLLFKKWLGFGRFSKNSEHDISLRNLEKSRFLCDFRTISSIFFDKAIYQVHAYLDDLTVVFSNVLHQLEPFPQNLFIQRCSLLENRQFAKNSVCHLSIIVFAP